VLGNCLLILPTHITNYVQNTCATSTNFTEKQSKLHKAAKLVNTTTAI